MTYVIGTAGHVDHGKSSLVQALTGINPDRLAEEQAREMTIDLGFAWMTLPSGQSVGIVDVPGHRDFIENMLAGIGGIDLALFIIAADEGVMPQTVEHLEILDLLEIPGGIVALTKTDAVSDSDWLELVTLDVSDLLHGTILAGAPIVPVSARSGEGLDFLVEVLDSMLADRPPRADLSRPRLPIDRVFTISGFGTVVTGTLSGGSLKVGDEIEVLPAGLKGRVRGLQSHNAALDVADPGSRVAINLVGIDKNALKRGDVVTRPGLLQGTTLVDVEFRYLSTAGRPLRHNAEVKFFSGAAESLARVRLIGERELSPGETGWLQLRLAESLALDRGDRFILRFPSPGQTIGGGQILDAHPPHRWRRFKQESVNRFETLAVGTPAELMLQILDRELAFLPEQLGEDVGLDRSELDALLDQLEQQGEILRLPEDWIMSDTAWRRFCTIAQDELASFHSHAPLRSGMPREALRSRLNANNKVFNHLIAHAVFEGLLVDSGTVLRLPEHSVHFNPGQQAAIDRLNKVILANPYAPPSVKEATAVVGEDVFLALVEQKQIVQVSQDVFFDHSTADTMVKNIRDFILQHGSINVGEARDLFGSSRKYMLALLEYLDATGITVRQGDERILR